MSNFCTTCGSSLGFGDDFCGDCGMINPKLSTRQLKTNYVKSDYERSQYPQQYDTSEGRFIPLRKKLIAPIIFDKQTIKVIGNDKFGTFNALLLFAFNYYYLIFSMIFGANELRYWDREEFMFFMLLTGFVLTFFVLSLMIISWSYAVVLKIIGVHHSKSEIFRLACYSSNWIAVGATLAFISQDYYFDILLIIIFPYIYLAGFIISVSIYTERNFFIILLLGVIVAAMTWILGAILGVVMFIAFILVMESLFGSFF